MAVRGIIPINFNKDVIGEASTLGVVPGSARGGTLSISKFDTDIPFSQSSPGAAQYGLLHMQR